MRNREILEEKTKMSSACPMRDVTCVYLQIRKHSMREHLFGCNYRLHLLTDAECVCVRFFSVTNFHLLIHRWNVCLGRYYSKEKNIFRLRWSLSRRAEINYAYRPYEPLVPSFSIAFSFFLLVSRQCFLNERTISNHSSNSDHPKS